MNAKIEFDEEVIEKIIAAYLKGMNVFNQEVDKLGSVNGTHLVEAWARYQASFLYSSLITQIPPELRVDAAIGLADGLKKYLLRLCECDDEVDVSSGLKRAIETEIREMTEMLEVGATT